MLSKNYFLKYVLIILAWIIFVGLSIDAGGFFTNFIYTLFFKHSLAKNFWGGLDLSDLYQFNQSRFVMLTCTMVIAAILKAMLFYQIVRVTYEKKIASHKPFSQSAKRFIQITAYLSLGAGFFSIWGENMAQNLLLEGIKIPSIQQLKIDGGGVWILMGIILLVISEIFNRGIELQEENDLTV